MRISHLFMISALVIGCATAEPVSVVAERPTLATLSCDPSDASAPAPDAAPEASVDARADAVADARADAPADARADAVVDARADAVADARVDAPVDSGPSSGALHIVGNKLVDGAGRNVILKGANSNHMWDDFPISNSVEFGGNSVRVVFGLNGGVAGTTAQRKAVVESYISFGKIAVPGIWGDSPKVTCGEDPSVITGPVVAQWISDKAYLQAHEDKIVVNIANEWGAFSTVWRDTYITAVQALRVAGIRNVLMIDAGGGCGQFGESVNRWGAAIQAADPLHNVMFSVHLYAFWYKPGSPEIGTWQDDGSHNPWSTDQGLADVVASGLPIYIGEFADKEYEPSQFYDVSLAMATMDRLGIGGAAWMITNSHDNRWPGAEMSTDGTINHLTPFGVKVEAWARR